jgi:hypothetical protein
MNEGGMKHLLSDKLISLLPENSCIVMLRKHRRGILNSRTLFRMTSTHVNEAQSGAASLPLTPDELRKMDAYWRACNYLCAGMIYLHDNPLLKQPLRPEHFKNRLLGHWGSDPGQTFAWVHLNRVIRNTPWT